MELHLTNEGVVEYEDWGGRGFNLVAEDCGPSRGLLRRRAQQADPDGLTRWEAPRRLGRSTLP